MRFWHRDVFHGAEQVKHHPSMLWPQEIRLFVFLYALGLLWPLALIPFVDGAEAGEYLNQFTSGIGVWLFGLLPYGVIQGIRGGWCLMRRTVRGLRSRIRKEVAGTERSVS